MLSIRDSFLFRDENCIHFPLLALEPWQAWTYLGTDSVHVCVSPAMSVSLVSSIPFGSYNLSSSTIYYDKYSSRS